MFGRMREEGVDLAREHWDNSSCSAPERFRRSSPSLGKKNAGKVKLQLLETEVSGNQSLWEGIGMKGKSRITCKAKERKNGQREDALRDLATLTCIRRGHWESGSDES